MERNNFEGHSKRRVYILLVIICIIGVWLFTDRLIAPSLSTGQSENEPLAPVVSREALSLQESFAMVAEIVKPAVVNISTVQVIKQEYTPYEFYFGAPFEDFFDEFFGRPRTEKPTPEKRYFERKYEGTGSGVIIDSEGYILTNYHVVAKATQIKVTLAGNDEKKYDGEIIGTDAKTDLAVIKIKSKDKLPSVKLGDSDKVRVGEWAIAIGSPFGLEQTVTAGIISAKRQSIPIEGQQYEDMLQTDAAINRGNSGGPLVNIKGEIIGINSAIYAPTGVFAGIGFAIPINKAKDILDDLIHKGKVIRGWLGIQIKDVDKAIAKQFGLDNVEGILVNNVMKNTPAEKGGIKRGDIIIEFGGSKIKDVRTLQKIVAKTAPNKKVTIIVIRNQKEKTLEVITGEMPTTLEGEETKEETTPSGETDKTTKPWLGMFVQTVTASIAESLGLSSEEQGVVIIKIEPGTKAEEIGLQRGDCIKGINRMPIKNVEDFKKAAEKVKLKEGIVFDINRRGRLLYISIINNE